MPRSTQLTTCLSPAVYKMVRLLGFEVQNNVDIISLLDEDNRVCWDPICEKVSYFPSGEGLDYAESVRKLGPLCDAVHTHFLSLSNEKYQEAFHDWFQWTNNCEVFHNALCSLESLDGTKISLHLMKMISCLEHSLGDVYLIIGKDYPFLLRDLLASNELAKIFGQTVMDVLRIFLGSPQGLNLRNILWHGFVSPHEIPHKYCSMLLLLTTGLGQLLQSWLSNTGMSLVRRPYFVFKNLQDMAVFPDLNEDVLSIAESLIEKSRFVLSHMVPFWSEAITAFRQGRYADCSICLLPQLETGLRLIFTTVNECPDRMLTAKSTSLYTTFDEILAKLLSDGSHNLLPYNLGESAMEFLWDILNHQEGPRVRDHLSHGEIQLCEFPKEFAVELLGFSITLLHKHHEQDSYDKECIAVLYPIIDVVGSYQSRFHPIALVQKEVLQCCESFQKWDLLPFPSLCNPSENKEIQDNMDPAVTFYSETEQILSLLHLQGMTCFTTEDCSSWLQTDKWFVSMTELCRRRISNLFCPRLVLEAVGVLRKVSTQCHQVSNNIVTTSQLRYEQWQNRTLRSRQRQNYQRLLYSIRSLSPVLRLIMTIVIVDLHNIHSISEKTHLEYQKYLKHLKSLLQYSENMTTCTSPEKNRWDETIQMTSRIIVKIETFIKGNKIVTRFKIWHMIQTFGK
ncbi:endoplasmic reticulum membrane-associated RNA degradation protein isoform X2 [Bufo gargarizans]|nr:endoplasmic reticulum membrane-associated RNA degradation protein isoform X2 [Bufo gargarizans]XP_044146285.1 endoplasmic reticulum membrane-associated RNA degradation protein isoform X2 [Bufo gargarizans]